MNKGRPIVKQVKGFNRADYIEKIANYLGYSSSEEQKSLRELNFRVLRDLYFRLKELTEQGKLSV